MGTLKCAGPTTVARGPSAPSSCRLHVPPQRERFSSRAGSLGLPWRYRAEFPSDRPLQAPLSKGRLPRRQPKPQTMASTSRWFGGTTRHDERYPVGVLGQDAGGWGYITMGPDRDPDSDATPIYFTTDACAYILVHVNAVQYLHQRTHLYNRGNLS